MKEQGFRGSVNLESHVRHIISRVDDDRVIMRIVDNL